MDVPTRRSMRMITSVSILPRMIGAAIALSLVKGFGIYRSIVRTSAIAPEIAAAAAIAGLARWFRACGPCRPMKLRLEVDTERWPGASISPLAARHIEQPGWRHLE